MSKVYYIGLDVHKESIAVAIVPLDSTEVRKYGVIGGTLALDQLIRKLAQPEVELRFVYEADPGAEHHSPTLSANRARPSASC